MSTKSRARGPSKKRTSGLRKGARVVPVAGKLAGSEPFVPLVVTKVNADGTVELVVEGGGAEFSGVRPSQVQQIGA